MKIFKMSAANGAGAGRGAVGESTAPLGGMAIVWGGGTRPMGTLPESVQNRYSGP